MKSSVFVSKQIRGRQLVQIQQVLGCSIKNLRFTYLGAPLHKGRSKSEYFERLLQTITNKLEGWKAKFMSLAGKITLIYQELDKWKPGLTEEQWQTATLVVLDENTRDELWCSLTPYIKKYRTPPSEEGMDGNGVEYNVFKGGESLFSSRCVCCSNPTIETVDHDRDGDVYQEWNHKSRDRNGCCNGSKYDLRYIHDALAVCVQNSSCEGVNFPLRINQPHLPGAKHGG